MYRITTLLLSLLLAPVALASVPAADAAAKPRVGLVLSGGGSRGLAHVGVLKALEELKIPVSAIAGTSMGAVVGGLYAGGMTAAEVEQLVLSLDWIEAMEDRPPRSDLNFRRKQDDREFLVRLPLGLQGGKFRLPRGLVQGQKLTQVLRRETIPVASIGNFDELPTPFRAVATDLETGERLVLGSGDLTEAVRASMSAPLVFAPAEIGDRLLVDGGLVENLPVDVAKAMGVDIVIAVDVGFQPVGRKELNSALAVSNQMITIMMVRETKRQRALLTGDDVLIEPALGSMSSVDFRATRKTVALGYEATLAAAGRLGALGLDAIGWQEHLATRARRENPLPQLEFIRVDARSRRYAERIQAELSPAIGATLDPKALESGLSRLYGDDIFESLDYKLVREDGRNGIEVAARRKSWGPNYIRFGLELQDDFEGSNSFNAGVRALVTEVNPYGAEWQLDLSIGESPRFFTEFYQPLGYGSRWFIAPSILIERRNFDLISDETRLASYRVRNAELGLDLGREFGSWGELRTGLMRGSGRQLLRIGNPADPQLPPAREFERGEVFSRFSLDRLDNVYFPREGQLFTLQWRGARESLGADADADRVTADLQLAHSMGRSSYLLWLSGGSIVSGPQDVVQDFYSLGGLFNLSGLPPDALSGPHYGMARAIYYRRLGSGGEGFFNVATYAGVSFELGNVWSRRGDISAGTARRNGSAFIAFDSPLGPVYLAAGYDEQGGNSFYLLLGRVR